MTTPEDTVEESNLVAHARRELEFAGVEEDVRPSIIAAVEAFASYGHSGGSASVVIPMLNDLLNFKNIAPLTDRRDEWMDVADFAGYQVWQNRRNSEAFSLDGGGTYYLLSEERKWIPWRIRRALRKRSEYLVFPKHRSARTGFILGVAE